ncbi:MAG: insulinase family protein [Candidatus Eisenbacteria bacterium]
MPANTIGVLVGDFDPNEAESLIREYFGDIPEGPVPPPIPTREPPQRGMRRATLTKGTERGVFLAFPGVHPRSRNASVASLLSSVLSRDRTSRLDKRLDIEAHAVQSVRTSPDWGLKRYPGILAIHAMPLEGFGNDDVEGLIWDELDRLQTEPVSEERLAEIQSAYRKDYYYSLETNSGLADALLDAQAVHDDWRRTYQRFDEYESITPGDVTRLAADLFQREKASVVFLEPEEVKEVDHE